MGKEAYRVIWREQLANYDVAPPILFEDFPLLIYDSWGHSSGSISVALQMIGPDSGANKEDLFQSAFMQSGTVIPVGHIRDGQVRALALTTVRGNHIDAFFQKYYDFLVNETGCGRPKTDTLSCLRDLKYPILKAAIDRSPNFLDYQVCQKYFSVDELTPISLSVIKSCLGTTYRWYISQRGSSQTCGVWLGCQSAFCGWYASVLYI